MFTKFSTWYLSFKFSKDMPQFCIKIFFSAKKRKREVVLLNIWIFASLGRCAIHSASAFYCNNENKKYGKKKRSEKYLWALDLNRLTNYCYCSLKDNLFNVGFPYQKQCDTWCILLDKQIQTHCNLRVLATISFLKVQWRIKIFSKFSIEQ